MKRKLWVLFATIVAAVALAFGISACSPFVQLPTQPQPLGTPVVSISDEGIASWEPVVHAVGYSYLIDDAAEVSTTARNVQLEDGQTIQVKATGDGSLYLDSAYSAPATYHKEPVPELTQLATPVVSIDEEGLATWEAVPNASGYQYKLNGGEEKTLESDAELQVQLQDKDSIQVKAVGDGETYSDSEYSEAKAYTAPVKPQIIKIETPVVTIDGDGTAHWEAVAHASAYFYKIDGEDEIRTTKTSTKLQDGQTISVKACTEEEGFEDSDYSELVKYTAPVTPPQPTQLATPEVTIDEEGLATWAEVAHASGYKYKISGGEETTLVGAELQVQLEDKQYIEVKAVGDGETYSDSPYSAAKTYNAPAKPEPTQLATPEVTIDEEGLATWERVENATGYVCKVGGEEQEVQTELSIQLQSGDTLQVKAVSTDNEHFTESAYSDLQTYTKQPVEEKEKLLATFTLGDDHPGETEKLADGNPNVDADGEFLVSNPTYSETQGDYKLEITATADDKFYTDAFDNKGNGGFRLGSGSGNGNFTFTVPDDVKKVVFYVTAYKDKTTTVKINEKTFSIIDEKSVNGEYKRIEVEVPENHVITFATAGTGKNTYRCKINTIEFWGEAILELTKLDAPTLNVDSHTGDVTWEKVAGATSYTYTIDGENETTIGKDDELKVTLKNNQTISVIAKGDDTTYADSNPATKQYVHEHAYKTENNGWENDSDEGHYKKCTYCQEETGKTGHTYENGVCTECQYAHTDHKYSEEKPGECTVCHLKHTEHTYVDGNGKCHTCFAEHTGDDHVLATKTSSTHHWTECEVCGAKTAEIAHTHNTYGSDETQHWSVCECGATVPDTTEDHTYRNQNGKCDICEKEHANHDYGKSYISDDASGHHQVCTVCGKVSETVAHSTLQYTHDDDQHWQECPDCHWISGTKEGHTYNNEDQPDHCDQCGFDRNHVHQYTAWDSDDTYHWRYCPYHEGNKNFTDGKTLHQYDAAKGDGICTEENCKHAHSGHTFEQKNDKDNHWQECTTCYLKQSITAHSYDWKVSGEQHIHACTCGYQDVEGHTPNMQYVTTDPSYHWQKCEETGCTVTTENEKAPHTFVCESISDEQHQEKCECGATHEAQSHTYKNGVCINEECRHEHEKHAYKWVAEGTTHNHQCTVCEKIETSHTATPDTEAGLKHEDGDTHWYTCQGAEGCDLHVDETAHDEGTVYEEKDDTNHVVKCACGKVIKETEGHTYEYKQSDDGTKHYQECTACHHTTTVTPHEFNEKTAKPTNDKEQGNHYWTCECGAKKTEAHTYDPETHKCKCDNVDPDYTAATDAAAVLDRLGLATDYYYDSELTATLTTSNGDATISWSEGSDYLDIAENTLTITLPTNIGLEATETATLTAKITAGEITLNREYTLTLHKGLAHKGTAEDPFTVDDVKVIFERLDENEYYENDENDESHIKGFVTNVDSFFHQNSKYPGLYKVSIGPELTSSFDDTSVLIFRLYWDNVVMKDPGKYTDSDIPLKVHDEIIVKGYIQKFKNKGGSIQDEITYKGDVNPQLTYWLKESERPEKLFENNFFTELPETLTEGEDFELNLSQLNAPAGTTFTVESSNEAISVDGEDDYFILSALTPTDAPVKITIKATFQGVTASYEDYKTPWMINVKAFDYETYLQDALEAITDQIPDSIVEWESPAIKFADGEYKDIELTIESSASDKLDAEKQEDGSYLLCAYEAGTVQLTVTVKYTGTLTGSGESKKTDPAIEVTVVSETAADEAEFNNAVKALNNNVTVYVMKEGVAYALPVNNGGNVSFTWSSSTEGYTVAENKLTLTNLPEGLTTTVTLKVGGSCGEYTATEGTEVTITIINIDHLLTEALKLVTTMPATGTELTSAVEVTLPTTFDTDEEYFKKVEFSITCDTEGAVKITANKETITLEPVKTTELQTVSLTLHAKYTGEGATEDMTKAADPVEGIKIPKEVIPDKDLYTLSCSTKGTNSGYGGQCDIDIDGITWNVEGNSTTNPWRIGGSGLSNTNRSITSKNPITGTVNSIYFTFGDSTLTVKKLTLNVYRVIPTDLEAKPISSKEITYTKNGSATVTNTSQEKWTNCYYQIIFTLTTSGSSNQYVQVKTVVFKGQDLNDQDKADAAVKGIELKTTELSKPETSIELPTKEEKYNATISWKLDPDGVGNSYVELSGNKLTMKSYPEEDTKVTLIATATLNGKEANNSFTITVKKKSETNTASFVFGNIYGENNAVELTTETIDDVELVFVKVSGSSAPKYYSSDKTARMYNRCTLTIQGAKGADIEITEVAFSFDKSSFSGLTDNKATYSPAQSSVVFTSTTTIEILSITVTYKLK